jgi:transposase-like protein
MTTNDRGTIQRDAVYIYDVCEICNNGEQVLVYDRSEQLLCASHSREYAKANPVKQLCDRCGSDSSVVRDPTHRRNEYLCMSCHSDDGFVINNSVTAKAVREVLSPLKSVISQRVRCEAAGYGTDCDENIKPRGPWGGKLLCNRHGKTPPKPEKKK